MCSTTAVEYRHRAAHALARLVQTRPSVATTLVRQFKAVNDPQVFEAVLYAAAACAAHSIPNTPCINILTQAVHTAVFAGETVPPHILIRHYAQVVCDQAHKKGNLPPDIIPKSFRPPFCSMWPQIMSPTDETVLEAEHDHNWKSSRALGSLLSSTRTEQMGNYGDWGRYTMGSAIKHFQHVLLSTPPEPKGVNDSYDDRIARRYVLGRVLALGLDKTSDDKPPQTEHYGRSRPSIERLGKKYQWIAFHEFLGYLTDHYHYCGNIYGTAEPFLSATHFHLPDLLDPVLPEITHDQEKRENWSIARSAPWWVPLSSPYPYVLDESTRRNILSSVQTDNPGPLLRIEGLQGNWLALAGTWEWNEPIPCWVKKNSYNSHRASLSWHVQSYAVPIKLLKKFTKEMSGPFIDTNQILYRPALREELNALVSFPENTVVFEEDCADVHRKISGSWFTVADYSALNEDADAINGIIPSPQLARMASLRWTHHGLNFKTLDAKKPEFITLHSGGHQVTLMNATLLLRVFAIAGLQIVWRLHGLKWCPSSSFESTPMRDYWALFTLDATGIPQCIGGGTWILQPAPVEETLPW